MSSASGQEFPDSPEVLPPGEWVNGNYFEYRQPGTSTGKGFFNGIYTEYEQQYYARLDAAGFGAKLQETIDQTDTSETLTPQEFANRYQDIINLYAPRERLAQQINDGLYEALEKAVTPDEKAAVEAYAELLWWRYVAYPGNQPPEGMLFVKNTGEFSFNPYKGVNFHPRPGSLLHSTDNQAFALSAWDHNNELVTSLPYEATEQLNGALRQLIRGSDTYRFLSSFLASPKATSQRPLTPEELLARKSEIKQKIMIERGLVSEHDIDSDHGVNRDFARAISMLDEETRPGTVDSGEDEASQKFEQFLEQHLGIKIGAMRPMHEFRSATRKFLNANKLDDPDHTNSMLLDSAAYLLLEELIWRCKRDAGSGTYKQTFEEKLNRSLEIVVRYASGKILDYLKSDALRITPNGGTLDYDLKQPRTPVLSWDEYTLMYDDASLGPRIRGLERNVIVHNATYTSRESYLQSESEILATVSRSSADEYKGQRLVTSVLRNPFINNDLDSATLLINLIDNKIVEPGCDPFIPGYKLVYRDDKGMFGFAHEVDDPYLNDIDLPEDRLENLIDFYESLGVTELAEHVKSNQPKTIRELVKLISQATHYYLPEHPASLHNSGSDSFVKKITRDGKLYVQCDSAAVLLHYSLNNIASGSSARIAICNGNSLGDTESVITASKHAQVRYSLDGVTCIFDSTPSMAEFRNQTSHVGIRGILKSIQQLLASKPKSTFVPEITQAGEKLDGDEKIDRPNQQELAQKRAEEIERIHQERIIAQTDMLLRALSTIFKEADEEKLLRKIGNLKDSDPIRRTASLALKQRSGVATQKDVLDVSEYVANYCIATKAARKKAALPEYDRPTVSLLQSYLNSF